MYTYKELYSRKSYNKTKVFMYILMKLILEREVIMSDIGYALI